MSILNHRFGIKGALTAWIVTTPWILPTLTMLRIMKFIALDVIVKNTALTESVTEWVLEPSKLFKQKNKTKLDDIFFYFYFLTQQINPLFN